MAVRTLYSARLALFAGITSVASATVPAGLLWVVRDIDVAARVTTAGQGCYITGSAGQILWYPIAAASPASPTQQWHGRQILYPGEALSAHPSGTWDVTVSGYQLTLP